MQMKKYITGIVISILLVTLFSAVAASAASSDLSGQVSSIIIKSGSGEALEGTVQPSNEAGGVVKIAVSDAEVNAGREVKVSLSMTGKSIVSFGGNLVFDPNALKIVNIKGTSLLPEGSYAIFNQDESTKEFKSGVFSYASTTGTDMDGEVLEFTFKAKDKTGKYDLSLEDLSVFEQDASANVPLTCKAEVTKSGSITILESVGGGFNFVYIIIIAAAVLVVVCVVVLLVLRKKKHPAVSE